MSDVTAYYGMLLDFMAFFWVFFNITSCLKCSISTKIPQIFNWVSSWQLNIFSKHKIPNDKKEAWRFLSRFIIYPLYYNKTRSNCQSDSDSKLRVIRGKREWTNKILKTINKYTNQPRHFYWKLGKAVYKTTDKPIKWIMCFF